MDIKGGNVLEPFSRGWCTDLGIPGLTDRSDVKSFLLGLGRNAMSDDKAFAEQILRKVGFISLREHENENKLNRARRKTGPSKKSAKNKTNIKQRGILEAISMLLEGPTDLPDFRYSERSLVDRYRTDVYKSAEHAVIVVSSFYNMCTEGIFATPEDHLALKDPMFVGGLYNLRGQDACLWEKALGVGLMGTEFTWIRFICKSIEDRKLEPGLSSHDRVQKVVTQLESLFGCNFIDKNAALATLEEHLRICLKIVDNARYVKAADLGDVYKWAVEDGLDEDFRDAIIRSNDRNAIPSENRQYKGAVRELFFSIQKRQNGVFPSESRFYGKRDYSPRQRSKIIHCLNVPYERRRIVPAKLATSPNEIEET